MVKTGIIDPTKVTRSAIQNAISVSSVLLTTEVAVANEKEESPMVGGMPGGMETKVNNKSLKIKYKN